MVDRQLANKARMAARVVISQLLPQLALLPTSYTMLQCTTTADDIKWIESKQIQLVFFILRIHHAILNSTCGAWHECIHQLVTEN
jgi:hypothetical protein